MIEYVKKNYSYLIFSFFFISIICWGLEIFYSLITRGKFVFPGAWIGPYCPIYGFAFILIVILIKKSDNLLINIFKIFLTVTLMEYTMSLISDKIFNNIIWDYSDKFLNVNGRICLEMSILFTVFGILILYFFEPLLKKKYIKYFSKIKFFNYVLSSIFILDVLTVIIFKTS